MGAELMVGALGCFFISAIAVDATSVYWTDDCYGGVMKATPK